MNVFIMFNYNLAQCATELTNWGLWMTILQIGVSLKCSLDPEIGSKRGWLITHHILFELVTPINILITFVYWSLLREVALQTYADTAIKVLHSSLIHLMPLVCNWLNFFVTDVHIKASHGKSLLPFCLFYGYLNYATTIAQGKPVYHFITWEDQTSLWIFAIIVSSVYISFLCLAGLTKKIKRSSPLS